MRKLLTALFLAALGLAMASPSALAHAQLRSSDPRNGAQLDAAPDSISLTFTEPPEESLSRVHVLDGSGESWEQGDASVAESDQYTLRVPVEDLDEGVYTVTWRTVSKVDGHATTGVVAFGVGVDPAGAATSVPVGVEAPTDLPTRAFEVAGRWALLVGLVVLLGATSIEAAVLRDWSAPVRRLARIAAVVIAVGLVILTEGQRRAAEVPLGDFLATDTGQAIIWRTVALTVAVAGLIAAGSGNATTRKIGLWTATVGAAGAMFVHVNAGHAAASQSWHWLKVGSQWLHFVAVGVWIGGLAALLLGTRGEASADKAVVVRRFSTLAGIMLAAVTITGVFRAVTEVDGWGGLFSTSYGRVVLIKATLLLALLGLGAVNRYRSVPAAPTSLTRLRKVSRIELVVAGAALLAAALLATLNPAAPPEAAATQAPEGVVVTGSDFATSVRARLEVIPGEAGPNAFNLDLTDYDSGEPINAERVSLAFTYAEDTGVARSELELKPGDEGEYRAEGANLSLDGRWEITVVVERGAGSVEVPLEVATRCNARKEAEPGVQPVWVMPLIHGITAESWVDPGVPGHNSVHLTFFDSSGNEARITKSPAIVATTAEGEESVFDVERFGPGHFVSTGHLDEGDWRIELSVRIHGQKTQACYDETISSTD
jgi:copper transport protein